MKIIIVLILFIFPMYGYTISIKIMENGINSFINTVGSYSKTVKVFGNDIIWKLYDGKLDMSSERAIFTAKLDVITENKVRNGTLSGFAKFKFAGDTQNLTISIEKMNVEGLGILNLVEYYRPSYELPIKIFSKDRIAVKEDGQIKSYVVPKLTNEKVSIYKDYIVIEADIGFTEEKK